MTMLTMKTVLQVTAVLLYCLSISMRHLHAIDDGVHSLTWGGGNTSGHHHHRTLTAEAATATMVNHPQVVMDRHPLLPHSPPAYRNRSGKFLFDMLFGIESEVSNAFGSLGGDDNDYDDNASLKVCDCGEYYYTHLLLERER